MFLVVTSTYSAPGLPGINAWKYTSNNSKNKTDLLIPPAVVGMLYKYIQ